MLSEDEPMLKDEDTDLPGAAAATAVRQATPTSLCQLIRSPFSDKQS